MLGAYGKLHDSMMTHFRRRYPRRGDQRNAAVIAISLFLALNVLSIVSFLRFVGIGVTNVFTSGAGSVLIYSVLAAANFGFATWRTRGGSAAYAETPDVSRKYAVAYMVATVVAFLGSLVLLWYAR
jgi:hypothetical protein